MIFPEIFEYPFFTRSELSDGVQLADLLAYGVYCAFKIEGFGYPYFERVLQNFYRRQDGETLDGLKVWPDPSPLIDAAREAWSAYKQKTLLAEGRWCQAGRNHIEPTKGTRHSPYGVSARRCQ